MTTEHWTTEHFIRLKKEGFKYAFLPHGSSSYGKPENFVGMHKIAELHEVVKDWAEDESFPFVGIEAKPYADDRHLIRASCKDGTTGVVGYFVFLDEQYNGNEE